MGETCINSASFEEMTEIGRQVASRNRNIVGLKSDKIQVVFSGSQFII